jgi:predicted kinase
VQKSTAQKMIFVVGLPAVGKTRHAKNLSQKSGIHHIDIDELAAVCFEPPEENPYGDETKKERERLRMWGAYNTLCTAADHNLGLGNSVIVSATFSRGKYWNELFLPMLQRHPDVEPIVIWCQIISVNETDLVAERIDRAGYLGGCKSVKHYLADKKRYEPPPSHIPRIDIDTSKPFDWNSPRVLELV